MEFTCTIRRISDDFTDKPPITWENMRKFVSYLRVSTQRQGHSGLGLEAQRATVCQFVATSGGLVVAEYVEVESGSRRQRPILVQSIAQCRRDGATLVIAKLDRLARNVAFISSLMEGGVEFVAVDAPYANRLMLHVMAAFAEHERTLISERTRAALAAAKARGVCLGANGRRLAIAHKHDALAFAESIRDKVEEAMINGAHTLDAIACRLNENGCHSHAGKHWSPGNVQRLLTRLDLRTPGMLE